MCFESKPLQRGEKWRNVQNARDIRHRSRKLARRQHKHKNASVVAASGDSQPFVSFSIVKSSGRVRGNFNVVSVPQNSARRVIPCHFNFVNSTSLSRWHLATPSTSEWATIRVLFVCSGWVEKLETAGENGTPKLRQTQRTWG